MSTTGVRKLQHKGRGNSRGLQNAYRGEEITREGEACLSEARLYALTCWIMGLHVPHLHHDWARCRPGSRAV